MMRSVRTLVGARQGNGAVSVAPESRELMKYGLHEGVHMAGERTWALGGGVEFPRRYLSEKVGKAARAQRRHRWID